MARSGIVLYFDIIEPIRRLTDSDKGRLLMAMLEYGQNGTVPEFEGMLAVAWDFIKPKLDRDAKEYDKTIVKRKYAAFCRSRKKAGEPEVPFDEWLTSIEHRLEYHMISSDIT